MPTRQERRDSDRVSCNLVVPFKMTKPVDPSTVKFSAGHGHAINRSVGGMMLLLPEKVDQRQVVEIHVPSKPKNKQSIKLVQVCWTRPIPVSTRVKMYLAGTRFIFELPASG
jgi:PilZ domain